MPRPLSIQWNYKQWLGDDTVLGMDWDATGMHHHLLMISIQQEPPGSLPNDMALIRRWLRSPSDDVWRRVHPQVFSAWTLRGDRWFNTGMVETFDRKEKYSNRPQNGTKSVPHEYDNAVINSQTVTEELRDFEVDVGFKKAKGVQSRIPEEFMPKDEHYVIAAELGINCDLEFQKFRDYFLGLSGIKAVKRDWDATFRNWLRNSLNFGGRSNGREPTKAEQRTINSRRNILSVLGEAVGTGRAGVPVGDPTGPNEGLAGFLSGRKH